MEPAAVGGESGGSKAGRCLGRIKSKMERRTLLRRWGGKNSRWGLLACNTHRVPSCVGKGEGGGMSGLSHPDPDTGVLLSGEETTLTF